MACTVTVCESGIAAAPLGTWHLDSCHDGTLINQFF